MVRTDTRYDILEQRIESLEYAVKSLSEAIELLTRCKDEINVRMLKQDALAEETRRQLWLQCVKDFELDDKRLEHTVKAVYREYYD